MKIHAVIFDRDGVLANFDLETAARFFTPRVPLSLWEIMARWEGWGAQVGFPRSAAQEAHFFRGFWDALCDELELSDAIRADLHEFDYTRCMAAFDDVRPALLAVRAAGLRIGVLSNFSLASLDASLDAIGIGDLVDAACAATVIGASKPDAQAYRITAARLGVDPEHCLFLDDEEVCVSGARAVGMHAYRVDRTRQSHALDQGVVADLSALSALLGSLR